MPIDTALKRSLSKYLAEAHLLDLPEKFIGKKFFFAYEIHGQFGLLCGEIRGIEYSMAVGLHLYVSNPALETFRLKSLWWNQEVRSWNAIVEVGQDELLLHYAQGVRNPAPNCIPGVLEIPT